MFAVGWCYFHRTNSRFCHPGYTLKCMKFGKKCLKVGIFFMQSWKWHFSEIVWRKSRKKEYALGSQDLKRVPFSPTVTPEKGLILKKIIPHIHQVTPPPPGGQHEWYNGNCIKLTRSIGCLCRCQTFRISQQMFNCFSPESAYRHGPAHNDPHRQCRILN
jgi:hypothetical protein